MPSQTKETNQAGAFAASSALPAAGTAVSNISHSIACCSQEPTVENGVVKYEAWIILKIKFTEESQTTATKEGTIQWNTPTLTGRAAGLYIDDTEKVRYRIHETFDAIASAKSWINTVLNVSTTPATTT